MEIITTFYVIIGAGTVGAVIGTLLGKAIMSVRDKVLNIKAKRLSKKEETKKSVK